MSDEQQGPLGDGFDAFFRPGAPRPDAHDEPPARPRRGYVPDDTGTSLNPVRAEDSEPTRSWAIPATLAHAGDDDVPESDEPPRTRARHPFTLSLGLTALGTLLPGAGLLPTRFRKLGIAVLSLFLLGVVALAVYVLRDPFEAAKIATRTNAMLAICVLLVLGALVWVAIIVATHLATRPKLLTSTQRAIGALAVALLSFAVAAPLAVGARYSWDQANLVQNIFGTNDDKRSATRPSIDTNTSSEEVWKNHPRLNILLVGLDNSAVRKYQAVDVSTDTMMVASIDTRTGDMVLVQVPRNMAMTPFPPGSKLAEIYPKGYTDGHGDNAAFFANAIWAHVPEEHPELFTETDYPGADALKLGLEGATGLKIDYFVALNIDGLVGLIDAMGGVKLNVNERIPVAGSSTRAAKEYIEPGPEKKLSGYYAMWYARSRSNSTDFARMSRQSCVIDAVIEQADPQTMLTRYEAIARAGTNAVSTDIPSDMLPHLVDLSARVKNGRTSRVLFVHGQNGYVTFDPDFEMMQRRVAEAIGQLGGTAPSMPLVTPTPTPLQPSSASASSSAPETSSAPSATDPAGKSASPTGSPSPKPIENLSDACAYHPVK